MPQLFELLLRKGISDDLTTILARMYQEEESTIKINNRNHKTIKIRKGVRQGSVSSPFLFLFVMNELVGKLETKMQGYTVGTRIKKRIRTLMFADDLVLLANTPTEMNRTLRILEEWANEFNLEINTNKSELIVQRNNDKTPVKLFGETLIPKKELNT